MSIRPFRSFVAGAQFDGADSSPGLWQRGFTLVELLVALAISTVIALAAVAALTVSRYGFTTVDAASQLRDNGRFISDLVQRLGGQLGYRDVEYVMTLPDSTAAAIYPDVYGFNNQTWNAVTPSLTAGVARVAGSVGEGSDVLILSFQPAKKYPDVGSPLPGWNDADGSVIDCLGNSPLLVKPPTAAMPVPISDLSDRYLRMISVLHVAIYEGEPTLMCTTSEDSGVTFPKTEPLIQGVENFQVLYGTDGVTAGVASADDLTAGSDSVPDAYLRADQITIAGNPRGSYNNWRRVRSLRIGIVLRAKTGTNQNLVREYVYPFGNAPSSSGGATGSALMSASDKNSEFQTLADGRLRQVVTFTVYLHNQQEL